MKIEFTPQFSGNTLSLSLDGEMLVINGELHDFSALPVGGSVGPVGKIIGASRDESGLTVLVILPHGSDADASVRFPEPVTVTQDGPIAVPGHDAPEPPRTAVFVVPYTAPPTPTQFELDQRRYQKRAAVQSELISWMAADNMSRVRSGVWTVADLTSLMSDPAVTAAQAYMSTLSYELAAQAIAQATTPLLTQAIKDVWIGKLTEHFYLVP